MKKVPKCADAHPLPSQKMITRLAVLFFLFLAGLSSSPLLRAAEDAAGSTRSLYKESNAEAIAEQLTKLSQDKANRVADEGTEVRIDAARDNAMYSFTKAGHPAHPAMVRREFGQRGGKVFIDTTGTYAGNRAEFEKWFGVFLKQDDEIRARLQPK